MERAREPLLNQREVKEQQQLARQRRWSMTFTADAGDIEPINGLRDFSREFWAESMKLWYLAGPFIFTTLCQSSLGAITQIIVGHVGTLELAAFSVVTSVIAGFSLGVMLGMGSALETLCGQAFGANQPDMLGIYLQRSWVILTATAVILCPLYIFAGQLLKLIGQTDQIAEMAGTYAIWMIPQLFSYAVYFPTGKFLQAQSKIMAMAVIAAVVLVLHCFFCWLLMIKLGWGLVGAAVVLNASWWLVDIVQLVYIFSGTCGRAWSGFSWMAFQNLWGFVKLSLASAVMLCLEVWYFTVLILFAGYLSSPEVSVDALSVCMNILGWAVMAAIGANAAVSVRVSNELGARHPRTAKFSVVVVVITSFMIGLFFSLILIITRKQFPSAFTSSEDVQKVVYELTPLLALSITINNVQPVLSGVAIGAGWQAIVAYVNIASYYIVGIPLGLLIGFILNFGITGIWCGMLSGTVLQTIILIWITCKTNWTNEASIAEERIRNFGGEPDGKHNKDAEK